MWQIPLPHAWLCLQVLQEAIELFGIASKKFLLAFFSVNSMLSCTQNIGHYRWGRLLNASVFLLVYCLDYSFQYRNHSLTICQKSLTIIVSSCCAVLIWSKPQVSTFIFFVYWSGLFREMISSNVNLISIWWPQKHRCRPSTWTWRLRVNTFARVLRFW